MGLDFASRRGPYLLVFISVSAVDCGNSADAIALLFPSDRELTNLERESRVLPLDDYRNHFPHV